MSVDEPDKYRERHEQPPGAESGAPHDGREDDRDEKYRQACVGETRVGCRQRVTCRASRSQARQIFGRGIMWHATFWRISGQGSPWPGALGSKFECTQAAGGHS